MKPDDDWGSSPSRWPSYALMLVMLLWVFAFTREPLVLATVPGVIGFLAVVERAPTTRRALLLCSLFGAVAIGAGYHWLANFATVAAVLILLGAVRVNSRLAAAAAA